MTFTSGTHKGRENCGEEIHSEDGYLIDLKGDERTFSFGGGGGSGI
jgi:hypothetical protein